LTPRGSSRPIVETRQIPVIAVTVFAMAETKGARSTMVAMPKPIREKLSRPDR